tara:strand:+ start:1037 stop:1657 length:621 start_codon:yes stop_codon:yes gene_type:complete
MTETAPVPTSNGSEEAVSRALEDNLERLSRANRRRRLILQRGSAFSSNDYIGLSRTPRLARAVVETIGRGVGVGLGGSRLLRGSDPEHEALEHEAAAWFGSETALYFATGYAANAALFATLPQRGDLIVYDVLIHASAHEGVKLSRADALAAGHNDAGCIDDAIVQWRAGGVSGGRGSPSKAFTAWMATRRRFTTSPISPRDMTAF